MFASATGRSAPSFASAVVAAERRRQDARWGGAAHDDAQPMEAFAGLIRDYAGWARVALRAGAHGEARERFVQVAALAVAAVESLDRRHSVGGAKPSSNAADWE